MGQQANYDQNQPKSVYYASSLPNSASTVAQAEPDATKNNYQKQAVSTISSAFETATNNSGTESNNNNAINSDQSADNLDELIQNKLTLQTSTEATNNQPPQPQYYYIAQPYTQNNPTDNSQAPPQPQPIPQYYYYYTPNSTGIYTFTSCFILKSNVLFKNYTSKWSYAWTAAGTSLSVSSATDP